MFCTPLETSAGWCEVPAPIDFAEKDREVPGLTPDFVFCVDSKANWRSLMLQALTAPAPSSSNCRCQVNPTRRATSWKPVSPSGQGRSWKRAFTAYMEMTTYLDITTTVRASLSCQPCCLGSHRIQRNPRKKKIVDSG